MHDGGKRSVGRHERRVGIFTMVRFRIGVTLLGVWG